MHIHLHPCLDDDCEVDDPVEVEPLDAAEAIECQRDLDRRRTDALYFEAHREEFLATYARRWIAVYQQQVVGADEQFDDLLTQLDAVDVPRGRVYIDRASDEDDGDLVIVFP